MFMDLAEMILGNWLWEKRRIIIRYMEKLLRNILNLCLLIVLGNIRDRSKKYGLVLIITML
jgi:hypothetical protein